MKLLERLLPPRVHRLVAELDDGLVTGEPQTEILNAFVRQGRIDGRRSRSSEPARRYVTEAAELALARIAATTQGRLRDLTERHAANRAEARSLGRQATSAPSGAPSQPTEGGGTATLSQALAHLAASRAEADRREADTARQAVARRREELEQEEERLHADVRLLRRDAELATDGVVEATAVVWARYTAGVAAGTGGEHTDGPAALTLTTPDWSWVRLDDHEDTEVRA